MVKPLLNMTIAGAVWCTLAPPSRCTRGRASAHGLAPRRAVQPPALTQVPRGVEPGRQVREPGDPLGHRPGRPADDDVRMPLPSHDCWRAGEVARRLDGGDRRRLPLRLRQPRSVEEPEQRAGKRPLVRAARATSRQPRRTQCCAHELVVAQCWSDSACDDRQLRAAALWLVCFDAA